jgi:hypothetical protein
MLSSGVLLLSFPLPLFCFQGYVGNYAIVGDMNDVNDPPSSVKLFTKHPTLPLHDVVEERLVSVSVYLCSKS